MTRTDMVPPLEREDSAADSRTLFSVSPTAKPTVAAQSTLSAWSEDEEQQI